MNGFIRAYGTVRFEEDMATYHEKINNPSFFKPLIDPESSTYNILYQQKLDLLLKYKYITPSEYEAIMVAAGQK